MSNNNNRYFEVMINNKFQGIYSDSSPIKTARKIAKDLLGNKKSIIFYLKEKSKSKKNYGPYIGYMNNEKIVVKKYKMSGGGENDYNWSDGELQTAFLNGCKINDNPPYINFAIKQISYNGQNIKLVIFGFNPIYFNSNTYLGFILYIYNNLVKIKEIIPTDNGIIFKSVTRDNLKEIIKDRLSLDQLLLDNFKSENMSFGNIQKYINDNTKNSVPISTAISASQSSNSVAIQKPNTENKWNYNRNKQVTIKNDIICFGPHLVNGKYKYKYTYNKNTKFYEIDENNNQKEIDIKSIPLYDLLSLYEFAKKNQESYLIEQIKSIIKPNELKNLGKTFFKLDGSNFNKNKNNSNFGKFKKRTMGFIKKVELDSTGTTYIFFNLKNGSFQNVCFQDGEEAFYYTKENINNKLKLNDLDDIDALKNLVVYILLIRILHNKPKFAEVILNVARSNLSRKFNESASTKSITLNGVGYLRKEQLITNSKLVSPLPQSPQNK